jgi:hypothetical protein
MEIRRKHSSAFRCAVPPVPNRPSKHLQGEQTPLPRRQWWPGRFHQEAVVERRSSSTPTWPSGGANEAIRQPVPETDSASGREIHFRSCRSFHRLEHPWGSNKGCSGQFLLTALTIWQRNFPLSIAMSVQVAVLADVDRARSRAIDVARFPVGNDKGACGH